MGCSVSTRKVKKNRVSTRSVGTDAKAHPKGFKDSIVPHATTSPSKVHPFAPDLGEDDILEAEIPEPEVSSDEQSQEVEAVEVVTVTRSVHFEIPELRSARSSLVLSRRNRISIVSSHILDLVDAEAEESDEDLDALLEEIGYFKSSRVSVQRKAG